MVFKGRLSADQLQLALNLRMTKHLSYRKIASELNISSSSAHRFVKQILSPSPPKRRVKRKLGRPLGLSTQDKRKLEEAIFKLRKKHIKYTVKKVVETSGICSKKVSYRTFSRYINAIVKGRPEQSSPLTIRLSPQQAMIASLATKNHNVQVKKEPSE